MPTVVMRPTIMATTMITATRPCVGESMRMATRRLRQKRLATCRMPMALTGCQVVDEKVYCDQSIADEGAPCDDDGATSCASDGKRTLRCQNGAFVAGRACPHACKALAAPATAI